MPNTNRLFVSINTTQPGMRDNEPIRNGKEEDNENVEDIDEVENSEEVQALEDTDSVQDSSASSTKISWDEDTTALLLKVALGTDVYDETFKNGNNFSSLLASFKANVDSNKCNNKFKAMKKAFKKEADRTYLQTGCDHRFCPSLYGTITQAVTVTSISSSRRITREYLATSQPLEIINEGLVVDKSHVARSPDPVAFSVST
ncbi:hypothetical protein PHYBLDRAFT_142413 [Phycomyces blakesleeanus NRRL 1555(-)]|uniref:Uncharacterized protein n=1 Tax=Phycomyces blakesleeanus (strain ATCC 8743b / DSM 1359 / FGSC 10004 / NBRC 33097 / NRRL 1555) TaxID=763407 RepID=A0A162PXG7_PHYB8|nr:hypothetical protein PHYBLDRAFT_142413 [Phycomyces blakesleeanus NRRL 1555(-)]OAD76907.1 hypothetical protein PHYBLDRAFT_142413 [Phycomyces blakesleeanus NRRL 1555(-)]|eukprot:XP_018294947.1 hypothetical protein PHYBLDRAFT_142413 [Phycomyces blakesleeanus NRRL 1555(-)]